MRTKLVAFLFAFSFASSIALALKPQWLLARNVDFPDHNDVYLPPANATYRLFAGELDDRPIMMKLNRDGSTLSGVYWFHDGGTEIPLRGLVSEDGSIQMREFAAPGDLPSGWFSGNWYQNSNQFSVTISGTWAKALDGQASVAFDLSERLFDSSLPIESDQISEDLGEFNVKIRAEYPQIVDQQHPLAQRFNETVRNWLIHDIARYKTYVSDIPPTGHASLGGSYYATPYDVLYADGSLISVFYIVDGYRSPAFHPVPYFKVFNFDLKDGRLLRLEDLFRPGTSFLKTISERCVQHLLEEFDYSEDVAEEDSWFKEGTAPKSKNYQNWAISKQGLVVGFELYQIGTNAMGESFVTIPWSELSEIINPAGPLAGITRASAVAGN